MDWERLGKDLREAREEITLQDLTKSQWERVCNRIANCIHKQVPPSDFDWKKFMEACGLKERNVA